MSELQRARDRIEELERMLGIGEDEVASIKLVTGLPPVACKVVGILRRRPGVVSREAIYSAIYGHRPECDQPLPKIIDVEISKARAKLRPLGIEIRNIHGSGYFIEGQGRQALTAMMAA